MASTPLVAPVSNSTVRLSIPNAEAGRFDQHTYAQILKSAALIGGSSVVTIAFGIVRTKTMAVLLVRLGSV